MAEVCTVLTCIQFSKSRRVLYPCFSDHNYFSTAGGPVQAAEVRSI